MSIPKNKLLLFLKASLLLFVLSTLYGWLMRLNGLVSLPFFNYGKVLQAHSHVTFLGWGYLATTVLFNHAFLAKEIAFSAKYKRIFILQFISIALMLVSFPLQGYKVFSVVLLSVFAISSYFYFYFFYKDYKKQMQPKHIDLFIKASIFYYILAMFAIWAVGAVVATRGKGELYHNTVYFYLHFLYNGFFLFALFALFFNFLTKQNQVIASKARLFFWYLNLACIPTYLLSLVVSSNTIIIGIGFIGAVLQLAALYYFILIYKTTKHLFTGIAKSFFQLISISFVLKILFQFGSAFPYISHKLPQLKSYFVIGYIHLVTLGIISSFLILFLVLNNFIKTSKKTGFSLFIIGVISTELLFFTQGFLIEIFHISIPYYTTVLLFFSTVLVLAIILIYKKR